MYKTYLERLEELKSKQPSKIDLTKLIRKDVWTTNVVAETFEVGDIVYRELEEGQTEDDLCPVGSGEYFMEDGTKIQIDSEGKVILITPAND
jgi:hypothetical protein